MSRMLLLVPYSEKCSARVVDWVDLFRGQMACKVYRTPKLAFSCVVVFCVVLGFSYVQF